MPNVEYNLTASDRTGTAVASAERNFKRSRETVEKENQKLGKGILGMFEEVSPKAAQALTGAFANAASAGPQLLLAGAAAAAPFLGAAISAAMIAGAGVGAAAIGVAIVAQDARVQAAGKQLGQTFMEGLQQDASPFIGPVLKGINTIEERFQESRATIQRIFANASQFVEPLVDGATRGLQGILRGVDALVANARPVINVLSQGLQQVGEDFGEFMEQIAGNGEDAAAALGQVFDFLSMILDITGPLISALTKVFGFLDKLGFIDSLMTSLAGPLGMVYGLFDDGSKKTDKATDSTSNLGLQFQKLTGESGGAASALQQQSEAALALLGAQQSLFDQTTNLAAATDRAREAGKKNGATLDENTEKGRANREALSNVARAMNTYRDGLNKAGRSAIDVNGTLRDQISQLYSQARRFGATKEEAATYAAQLLGIPKSAATKVLFDKKNAAASLAAYHEALDGIPRNITTIVQVMQRYPQGRDNADKLRLSADSSFAFAANGSGYRTVAPTPVSVDNKLSVNVTPDLSGIRAAWRADIREADQDRAWRTGSGKR